ncbi:MAG: T9SS type A sorting domain-containing protein [Bacteroidetes bacterium]|nr:T9SS type A sorting domain-containing protein [Bacteroidota bacterium]
MKKIGLTFFLLGILLWQSQNAQAQTCTACFTATPDTTNSSLINLDATCSNASPNALYDWYIDGALYLSFFPIPYFQVPFYVPGQHIIDLVIYDGACVDSATQVLNITNCSAGFTTNQFSGGVVFFYPNYYVSTSATCQWDFGDGNTSNTGYPMHTYAAPGTYTVCCILNTFGGCSDTSCQSITVTGTANCDANFYYNIDPFTGGVSAEAGLTSVYNANNYSMNWYVNGILSQQGAFTGFYTTLVASGNYELKLVLTDTNMNACDSMSELIYWNGGIISNPGCYPCFSSTYNSTLDSLYFDASCSIVPIGGSLLWNINGTSFPDPGNGFMQGFPTIGYQVVALYALDSNNVVCDSLFQPVYTYGAPCVSCLSVTQSVGSTSDYIFDGACNAAAVNYSWFIDNSFVATTNSPQFYYSFTQSGSYSVCLQTMDALGTYCNQSCTTVVVSTPTVVQYTLSGVIQAVDSFYNYTPVGNGDAKVYLIKLMTGGILNAIDSTTTDATGRYTFSNKPIDDYRIKVALNPGSPNYTTNIPTYFTAAYMWYNAQVVTLFANTYNKDIFMNYGANMGGSGFIGGNVFLGSNKPTRSSNADVTLILIDQFTQLPVAYAKTNANGDYSFSNVPYGVYKIYGELLNRASIPENIEISATQLTLSNKNFVYNDNVIKPTNMSLSVNEVDDLATLSISPNPAQESFSLVNSGSSRTLQILDLTGRIVQQFEMKPSDRKTIDCSRWNKGVYFVNDLEGGKRSVYKMLVN